MHVLIFCGVVLVFQGATYCAKSESHKCHQTKECPDSGTVCKMALSDAAEDTAGDDVYSQYVDQNSAGSNEAFDPPLNDDPDNEGTFNDELQMDDVQNDVSMTAKVAVSIKNSTDFVKLKPGVNVTLAKKKDEDEVAAIVTGTRLLINGWSCMVTDIKSPGKTLAADAIAFNGSSSNDPDSVQDDSETSTALQNGKKVVLGAITCKIVGRAAKLGKPSAVKSFFETGPADNQSSTIPARASSETSKAPTTSPIIKASTATSKASTSATSATTKSPSSASTKPTSTSTKATSTISQITPKTSTARIAVESSTNSTTTPLSPSTSKAAKGAAGRCVCDAEKRFACETDEDCHLRFRTNLTIACFRSLGCPTDLGIGYCRMVPDEQFLQDAVE